MRGPDSARRSEGEEQTAIRQGGLLGKGFPSNRQPDSPSPLLQTQQRVQKEQKTQYVGYKDAPPSHTLIRYITSNTHSFHALRKYIMHKSDRSNTPSMPSEGIYLMHKSSTSNTLSMLSEGIPHTNTTQ